ncbi:3-hydroxyacyl CoA dehydrogenase oxidoreductase protein [Legionella quinlivanii]|uniref:enoyl-CoA hydratase n=1 Tax=Legionella quinlivanii TaxID=45073 RepID=A0A0W0Y4N1_9GAMM|nr:3-hydroxyacyl-CoA dehydrogenase/enoyl-CoA hydratase family protein [Legionella quinlivanii]KTD51572.1 3-hydroxyacyl CoA dehydrogenase oxidoreductase protein [Legionella quinlivanii]SEF59432.1 3-hydroxyacyl-CoA dehydrogenase [Legionella quinlivanii DSM 21216]STY10901.1 3-hydroxyacyl-CoA dehydrogenase [Legionella quinlivanii]
MQEPFYIKKIAVLGAGVMGAQIAAHCVNAGISCLLYDLAAKDTNKNSIVDKAIANLVKLKPAPLGTAKTAALLQARNYDEHLEDLKSCDLIIEAIAERMDWKESLYQKIAPFVGDKTVLVSNTSGLSINALAEVLPASLRERFCGVHFFNPPRYMHLAELIPATTTSNTLLTHLETWLTSYLGKGVVHAKDTPNFIANRIGVFSLLATLHHAEAMQIGLDEVDAITGSLLGRPKSATFRTMDVVGLDTMKHVVHTMYEQLKDDPWHDSFVLPAWLEKMIEQGHLGQKSGQGIYRKPGKVIEVFDRQTEEYRPAGGEISSELKSIMSERDPQKRMSGLLSSKDRQAQFLAACFLDLFHYCAYHLESIANNVRDVDLAIRWGFGWAQGPFETWQQSGLESMITAIKDAISKGSSMSKAELPAWLSRVHQFYHEGGAFSPQSMSFIPRSSLSVYHKQYFPELVLTEHPAQLDKLYENEGLSLSRFKNDIGLISFKSKANTIGQAVLDGMAAAMDIAERHCRGVIVYQQDASNFSSGADLKGVGGLIQKNDFAALETMLKQFQQTVLRLKYSPIPVVAALRGRALGGGCELIMHCDAVVAAFESYPGLVEAGVGLIPAGGGTKEMAMRAAEKAQDADLLLFLSAYFQQIATATVGASAADAQQLGYLKHTDTWVMNSHEVLYAALSRVEAMLASNYQPPIRGAVFKVAGREGYARLQAGLINWLEGGFISKYDYYLASQLASAICGGDVNNGTMVNEDWMLKLEREAFMNLARNPLTHARISSLLETGKPLRN